MLKKLCVFILIFSYGVSQAETSNCTISELLNNLTATRSSVSPYKINDYKKYPFTLKNDEKGFFDIDALIKRLDKQPILKAKLKILKRLGRKRIEVTLKSKKKPEELTSIQRFIQTHLNNYDNKQTLAYFESPEIGKFEIYSIDLLDDMTTVKDFSNLTDFNQGEYVHFKNDTIADDVRFQLTDSLGINSVNDQGIPETAALNGSTSNLRFKFVRPLNEEEHLVSLHPIEEQLENKVKENIFFIKVKREDIARSFPENTETLKKQLEYLDDISLTFIDGEKIRFRDATGALQSAVLEKISADGKYIISHNSKQLNIEADSIFKAVDNSFSTPQYNHKFFPFSSKPEGLYKRVLNGASKVSSKSEFKSLKEMEQISILTNYVKRFVQPTDIANTLEFKGYDTLNKILCTGTGVCRHNATVLATVLKESGFNPKFKAYITPGTKSGHAWLEIMIDNKLYVLDGNAPGEGFNLYTMEEALKYAKEEPNSFDAIFYTQPNREEILPTPLK